ncbi:MAG: hypothetical protein HC822_15805, partial [Oscillochloris sp.]|nr:hypothetical protein [Oscillochloris sp.]
PAVHRPAAANLQTVSLTLMDVLGRHAAQRTKLAAIAQTVQIGGTQIPGLNPLLDQCACYNVAPEAQEIRFISGEPAFREALYLFNLIVAMEWNPSPLTYQQIRLAATRASDFLYDVTNGYMAIGQVIVGGSDLMDVADIQIMASNRIHPRSWMSSLNEARKFKPIRVGRGLWQKNQGTLLSWDSPEGYRSLIHEWGHYAFGLADEYLRPVAVNRNGQDDRFWRQAHTSVPPWTNADSVEIAVPGIALPVESLMASTQISEFAALDQTYASIRKYYPLVQDPIPLEGPPILSLQLPHILEFKPRRRAFNGATFERVVLDPAQAEDSPIAIVPALAQARVIAETAESAAEAHWLYVLKGPINGGVPTRLIAQGKVGKRDAEQNSFQLLGAAAGDQLVMVSQVGEQTVVQRAALSVENDRLRAGDWANLTPPELGANEPLFVDILPDTIAGTASETLPMQAGICVQIEAPIRPSGVNIYPAGAYDGITPAWPATGGSSEIVTVPHLDGHVLAYWAPSRIHGEALFICSYSQGGGPRTSSGGLLPVTGGSADGNAMIFFNDNIAGHADAVRAEALAEEQTDQIRLVTTTITVGQQRTGTGAEARSYIFSLASNAPIGAYKAALVLHYDTHAPQQDHDLLIYRWNGEQRHWQRLTTFAQPGLPYVAVPIGSLETSSPSALETAPALTAMHYGIRVERYRIFLTPVPAAQPEPASESTSAPVNSTATSFGLPGSSG